MKITFIDWVVVAAYFAANLLIGFYYRKKASASTGDFFISGRQVTWWLAGSSMVAATFAADTPLAVTGLVARQGIAANWLWWSLLLNGMMTVFFFARFWRRAEVVTDAELVYVQEMADWLDDENKPHPCNGESGYKDLEIMMALCRSVVQRGKVKLPLGPGDPELESLKQVLAG